MEFTNLQMQSYKKALESIKQAQVDLRTLEQCCKVEDFEKVMDIKFNLDYCAKIIGEIFYR